MKTLHDLYFHAWHWLFQQVQLGVWFGNIVAGVVVFCVVSLFWPKVRHAIERFAKRHLANLRAEIHAKLDAQHKEKMEQAERHHQEKTAQAERHHKAQLAAIRKSKETP